MIHQTEDYAIFKIHAGNRPIDPINLKKIQEAMKVKNLLPQRPILVNKHMEVIDGGHRLKAAQSLKLPVYYIKQDDSSDFDMVLLNRAQKNWSLADYINFYASQGLQSYINVRDLATKYNLTIVDLLILCCRSGGTTSDSIRAGSFTFNKEKSEPFLVTSLQFIQGVTDLIRSKSFDNCEYLGYTTFKKGLLSILGYQGFNGDRFFEKLKKYIGKVHACNTIAQYTQMFKSIYNCRNSFPIKESPE